MTIKDDPQSHLKAADAKAVMGTAPFSAVDALLDRLCRDRGFKAIIAFRFNQGVGQRSIRTLDDERGDDILQEWAGNTLKAVGVPWFYGCILVGVRDDGPVDTATWGIDREACALAANWRDDLTARFISVAPFQTWFGWGNSGQPKRMKTADLQKLTDGQQAWVNARTHPQAA